METNKKELNKTLEAIKDKLKEKLNTLKDEIKVLGYNAESLGTCRSNYYEHGKNQSDIPKDKVLAFH